VGIFDELVAKVGEEDRLVLAKYPELQSTVAKLESDYHEADRLLKEWETWKAANWDEKNQATKQTVEAYSQLTTAQQRITELETAGATDMTWEDLQAKVRAEAESVVAPKLGEYVTAKQHQEQINALANGMEVMFSKTAPLLLKHQREFSEDLDPQQVFKYMQENRVNDPTAAYDQMVAPRRAEAQAASQKALEEKHLKDIEEAREAGAKAKAEELAMSPTGSPTDMGGPAPMVGQLDRLRMADGAPSDGLPEAVQKARLGDGRTAQAAYDDWRKSKAATTVQ